MRDTVLIEPTAEMRFHARWLGDVLYRHDDDASDVSRGLGRWLVTPLAHVAWNSLDFQTFLFEVFHQSRVARWTHYGMMPTINLALLTWAAGIGPASASPLAPSLAMLLAGVWIAWQVGLARSWGVGPLGAAAGAVSLAQYLLATTALPALGAAVGVPAGHPGWIALAAVAAAIQAGSHGAEPLLPPRVSDGDDWVPVGDWLRRRLREGGVLRVVGGVAFGFAAGVWNELTASPRLQMIGLLRGLVGWGWRPAPVRAWFAAVRTALDAGDPALDVIGTGGTSGALDVREAEVRAPA